MEPWFLPVNAFNLSLELDPICHAEIVVDELQPITVYLAPHAAPSVAAYSSYTAFVLIATVIEHIKSTDASGCPAMDSRTNKVSCRHG